MNRMCKNNFIKIYNLVAIRESIKCPLLEGMVNCKTDTQLHHEGDNLNEHYMYNELFSPACNTYIMDLFHNLIIKMKHVEFEKAQEAIEGLVFIQIIGATALWKYNCAIDPELENFVRDFDRLDVQEERRRLYLSEQA